ncbi:MAG: hypothetical protein IJF76_05445 [Clostridia bacterium]|nr:hypothetical protein [Clostridia bacterium]
MSTEGRTKKFALNTVMAAISQIVVLVSGLITPRLMIGTYGSEINGLVSSLHQFISYIMLVEAGIGGAAIYSLYKPLAENDKHGASRIVVAARKSYRQAGYIFSAGVFALAVIYSFACKTPTLDYSTIFPLTILLGVNGCMDFFLVSGFKTIITADQRNYVISFVSICQTVLRTIIIVVCTQINVDVILLYGLVACLVFLKAGMIYAYGKKKYNYLDNKAEPDQTCLKKRWDVIYQQILGTVQVGAPAVIATFVLSLEMVSVYTVYNMVLAGINGILAIFITGLPAGFGDLIVRGETDRLQKSVSQFEVAYYYMLTIVYGLTMVLILPFVSIYMGGIETTVSYYYPLFAVTIVLNGLLYNIKTPQSMLVVSAGMYRETRHRVTTQGLIIIICGVLLGIVWGLPGIMIGSCLSNLYRTIDLIHFVPKYITHTGRAKSIGRMIRVLLNIVVICIPMFFVKFAPIDYVQWVLYALVYAVYAIAVVTITTFIFDRKELISTLKRFKSLLKRGK